MAPVIVTAALVTAAIVAVALALAIFPPLTVFPL